VSLLRRTTYADQMRGRLDGAVAVEWERGYFTRDRTDLPPSPTRLTAWQRLLVERGFRRR
jgi:hypothetical protein